MAVAVTLNGKHYFYNYGVASRQTRRPITRHTLFELGSISKTFTALLACSAHVQGLLSLSDSTSQHLPELRGSAFDHITLLHLATHTTGGLPMQMPQQVENNEQAMRYFREWQPLFPPGTHRSYANPSTGLLGLIAAKSLHTTFQQAMEQQLLPALGLHGTYVHVPSSALPQYAQGYTANDTPVRVNPGVFADEAYGLKSTAEDMAHFLDANLHLLKVNEQLKHAIEESQTGYFTIGEMTQALMWEKYPYPLPVTTLVQGTSSAMSGQHNPALSLPSALPALPNEWIHKTGSTAGFGGYVAFLPAKKMGLVLLANKFYPNSARVTAAHAILTRLQGL
jgi:CubicO group peptidase (beta-lactamase class C family)